MTSESKRRKILIESLSALRATEKGKEASMYGVLRDIFCDVLGYAKQAVVIDVSGERGRPDLTVYAEGGNAVGRVSWIVLEAKDERGIVSDVKRRNALFAGKAKYITADTAFFVMIDPVMMVMRSVGANQAPDVEFTLDGGTLEFFDDAFMPMRADEAGVPKQLQAFRDGDESLIAKDKLSFPVGYGATAAEKLAVAINRNIFFDTLTETTQLLQHATLRALEEIEPQRVDIQARVDAFGEKYGGYQFRPYPISIEGKVRAGREQDMEHRKDAQQLRRFLVQNPAISRLTLDALPRFADRTGKSLTKDFTEVQRFFATETANLILARIMLIRFLEDHGFFDRETVTGRVRRRYLCNGGVRAFQGMKDYFDHGYTRLLEEAYRTGGHFYSSAFDETEMDWIIAMSSPDLSRTLEWSLFRMSRFDFATARGDLMTGIYDRFLDKKQRKEQGEVYTPPSIARYILDRLNLASDAKVLDPACGSGTFLIERYRQVYGEIADSGTGNYLEAKHAIENLYGNDLNPFSAVLTQIQLLWHLLAFGDEIKAAGFPDLRIAERANSLLPGVLYDPTQSRFGEIDRTGYDAVVGNPPYVRNERAGELEAQAQDYFAGSRTRGETAFEGVGIKANAYTLFLYRALDHWCRQADVNSNAPGKVGFIVPLSLCTSKESAAFRKLLRPSGRFAIREIVDLELIWSKIFDADVLPMIVIIEAAVADPDDHISIRSADDSCVVYEDGAKRPTFTFDHLPEQMVRYADVFAPDGRIQTRLTPERVEVLKKLRENGTFADAAQHYWARHGHAPQLLKPTGQGEARWHQERLIREGFAKRGKIAFLDAAGFTTYKGENISTSMFTGKPVHEHFDVRSTSTPSVWAYPNILPATAYALPTLEVVPVAAPFDPKLIAIENTGTVFAPRADLVDVPFDAVLISTIYGFFHIVGNRRSFQNKLRNHLYPSAIADLPWNDALAARTADLVTAKDALLTACRRRYEQAASMKTAIDALDVTPLKTLVRASVGAKITRNDAFEVESEIVLAVGRVSTDIGGWILPLSGETEHAITFDREELAHLARAGLRLINGTEVTWQELLEAAVPKSMAVADEIDSILASFDTDQLEGDVYAAIGAIDAIVGTALGLSQEEIAFIQKEMTEDPFLALVAPRYPYFRPRQYGRRLNLERLNRYKT